jgi:prophage antirepressor-like protein
MDSSIQLFQFEGHEIRTSFESENLWFVAKDVCQALEIPWRGDTLDAIKKDWQGMRKFRTPGGEQETTIISEPAVYKLAFRSRKPEAERFTDWLASDVLPALRKTGTYTVGQPQGIAPTINMTLPDGTKLEGLPVSSIQHLIPQAVTPTVAASTIQPTLGLKEERKPGETVFHLESAVSHMESGWYTLVEVAKQIGCQPKTLNHKLLKRKLPKRWGSRWDKGKWWVYLP